MGCLLRIPDLNLTAAASCSMALFVDDQTLAEQAFVGVKTLFPCP